MSVTPLQPYRVVELSNERTQYAGHLFEQLGAEVIAVEPPGGSPVRQLGPFYQDLEDPEHSLCWWGHSRGKRSVVLDPKQSQAREQLGQLLEGSDFLLEGLAPGELGELGFGPEVLAARFPHLIVASITPFGQEGPKAHWLGEELVANAASGTLWTWGDADRPPENMAAAPQAFLHAGTEALMGCLMALHERARSGRGQRVDISAQAAMTLCTQGQALAGAWGSPGQSRAGGGLKFGDLTIRAIYPCKDGFVTGGVFFGTAIGPRVNALFKLMHQAGYASDWMLEKDFVTYMGDFMAGKETPEEFEQLQDAVAGFCADHTKEQIYDLARRHSLLFAPLNTGMDLASDPQLNTRDFWVSVEHEQFERSFEYPGPFARFSATPIGSTRRAPLLGEHTEEVLQTSRSRVELTPTESNELPLEGLKVLDLTWAIVGPAAIRQLADNGATVLKIESPSRPDPIRAGPPFRDGIPGLDRGAAVATFNAGKQSLSLKLNEAPARELLRELIGWADVVAEAFTPKVMNGWDLDYAAVRELNPSVIMLRTCLNGQTGADADIGGYGNQGSARAGYTTLLGWPDRAPSLPGAYSDYTSTKLVTSSILAALDHRRRTGEGQLIDLSQIESSVSYIAHVALEGTVNGRTLERTGNCHVRHAPYGVYPCRGDDCWIAIEVREEPQFGALARVLHGDVWLEDERFCDRSARKRHEEPLDAAIAQATRSFDALELEAALQAAGVPAHSVVTTDDCWREPQLNARGFFHEIETAETSPCIVERWRFKLSRTPAVVGPLAGVGEHSDLALQQILGLSEARIAELRDAGVVQ